MICNFIILFSIHNRLLLLVPNISLKVIYSSCFASARADFSSQNRSDTLTDKLGKFSLTHFLGVSVVTVS
jgi:hypothetical protein